MRFGAKKLPVELENVMNISLIIFVGFFLGSTAATTVGPFRIAGVGAAAPLLYGTLKYTAIVTAVLYAVKCENS